VDNFNVTNNPSWWKRPGRGYFRDSRERAPGGEDQWEPTGNKARRGKKVLPMKPGKVRELALVGP